jgi:hypothetical protein
MKNYTPWRRREYVAEACGNDEQLRVAVEALLREQTKAAITQLIELYQATDQPEKVGVWKEKLEALAPEEERDVPPE